jgi:hypothetical protein
MSTRNVSSNTPSVAAVAVAVIGALSLSPALPVGASTTWVVPTDVGTIQAAVDSAAAGDTVFVLPGTYFESVRFSNKDGLVLLGSGPEQTRVEAPFGGGEALVMEYSDDVVVDGFTWVYPGSQVIWGLEVGVSFRHNIVLYTSPGPGCGPASFACIRDSEFLSNSFLCIDGSIGNLLLLNVEWPGECSDPTPIVTIAQNLFWRVGTPIVDNTFLATIELNNLGAAYPPAYPENNIFENPLLCDPNMRNYYVAQNSPCLPGNNKFGLLLGALGEGCPPISVGQRSWGVTKALYR